MLFHIRCPQGRANGVCEGEENTSDRNELQENSRDTEASSC
jgi:hypothetical protein